MAEEVAAPASSLLGGTTSPRCQGAELPQSRDYDIVPLDPKIQETTLQDAPRWWGRRKWALALALAGLLVALSSGIAFSRGRSKPQRIKVAQMGNTLDEVVINGVRLITRANVVPRSTKLHAPSTGMRDWIVKLSDHCDDADIAKFCDQLPSGLSVQYRGHPSKQGMPVVMIRAKLSDLEMMLGDMRGRIEYVEEDVDMLYVPKMEMESENSTSVSADERRLQALAIQQNAPWHLDRIDQRDLPLDGRFSHAANSGSGVHLYILDTGIRTTHREFGGRAIPTLESLGRGARVCNPSDTSCADDKTGHGTHVAGVAAGSTFGVAKQATIHAVKVLDDDGLGFVSWGAIALDWIIANGQQPAVICMSLGCLEACNSPTFVRAVEQAGRAGFTVCIAAGNSNADSCNFGAPQATNAITVAATDRSDARAVFSNFGPCVDVFAPGTSTISASASSDDGLAIRSGTSFACPAVAGTAAMMLSQGQMNPSTLANLISIGCATINRVRDPGPGSPNTLLYSPSCDNPRPRLPTSTPTSTTTPKCFPGQSTVQVEGLGGAPMDSLEVGDRVLVEEAPGKFTYQPILAFLHAVPGNPDSQSSFLSVTHAHGTFRASANHLVFLQSRNGRITKALVDCQQGDELLVIGGNGSSPGSSSRILDIAHEHTTRGMYAPLTDAGTIVVDGVVASTYAVTWALQVPHSIVHFAFFPLRLYHRLGLASLFQPMWEEQCSKSDQHEKKCTAKEIMHPVAALYHKHLQLDRIVATLISYR